MIHFKYTTYKKYQSEKMKYGEDITFEGFLKIRNNIKMTRQGTGDETEDSILQ